ncbi:hypothetical protein [Streptomyces sp. NPDC093225]|uniref:hypothetical protein n=1 Tax=Streptomyces sp. NPDC093225 TaxID=3366034 RepID=UPI00381A4133
MSTVSGFVYVHDEARDLLRGAVAGSRVTLPAFEPPWRVVDHALEGVVVARWPGRLFRAEVVPPATDGERAALARAAENLRPGAGYTRAVSVDLVQELSPAVLFGPHGEAVCRVLRAAGALDEEGAGRLAAARHPAADRAYGGAWDSWLLDQPRGATCRGRAHVRTLAVPGAGPSGSPIGHGFSVLAGAVRASIRLRGGAGAYTVDEDGERVMADPWAAALGALLDAAMAFGAPHLLDDRSAAVLTTAWNAVFGPAGPNTGA